MKATAYTKMIEKARERRAKMRALRESGKTLKEIARRYGCSTQRIHQILSARQ
jgi:DNA-directed RNA polymerase sigma subunit (sigma70/sigma32)